MKIQCPCGAKYSFDVTPEMAVHPFQLTCPSCQTDLSAAVQPLILQVLGEMQAQSLVVAAVAAPAVPTPALEPPAPVAAPKMRVAVAVAKPAPALVASASAPEAAAIQCHRHPSTASVETCRVCKKPICPHCMTQFGYVCSAYCQTQAENHGIQLPEFAGQFKNTSARTARRFKMGMAGMTILIVGLIGSWAYYTFHLSKPHSRFTRFFETEGVSTTGRWADSKNLIVLRDGRLSRVEASTGKAAWEVQLISTNQFLSAAKAESSRSRMEYARWRENRIKTGPTMNEFGNPIYIPDVPSEMEVFSGTLSNMWGSACRDLQLLGEGSVVWVVQPGKAVRYNYADGSESKVARLWGDLSEFQRVGNKIRSLTRLENGDPKLTWLDLDSGETDEKQFALNRPEPVRQSAAAADRTVSRPKLGGTSPIIPVANQRVSGQSKKAAPSSVLAGLQPGMSGPQAAIAAIQLRSETRLNAALDDDFELGPRKTHPQLPDRSAVEWKPANEAVLKFTRRLVEFKPVLRKAMEDAPKKSALSGPVGMAQTTAIANEILNEMQRDKTDGLDVDDKSSYQATLELFGAGESVKCTSEVTGPPEVYVLPTLFLITADTLVQVFDSKLQKLWETHLSYPMSRQPNAWSLESAESWQGANQPFVERNDVLYILDPGVVSAFDKRTGVAKWRLPSVGATGLVFDDQGDIYINTTTMGQGQVRHSQQIDISRKDRMVLMKVEAATGRVLWKTENCGPLAGLDGPFVYTSEIVTTGGGPMNPGLDPTTQLLLCRLHPKTGKLLWEHASRGAPVSLGFQKNNILIVRPDRLDVLGFMAF